MSDYRAPIQAMQFAIEEVADLAGVNALPGFEEATPDVVAAVLEEAGKFAQGVLSPLNAVGDRAGCQVQDGVVTTPPGWQEAYDAFCTGGWSAIASPLEYGGQGLPKILSTAVSEMWQSANLSFSLLPLLTTGAIHALLVAATQEMKARYLPSMVAGTWAGTMNLTEPQAGSDLAQIRARAEPQADGTFRLFGQKIFITYGEHEQADNIIHLVLARLPDAPAGVKGISMFLVPKFLVNPDGSTGARNDVKCVSLEHKLGIHASPTCVMAYGDRGGATGYLVGEANRGLEYMFVMMNEARFSVGTQGIAIAERAYQQALEYAQQRLQGRNLVTGEAPVPIIQHPDIRRMLLTMQTRTQAARMLAYWVAAQFDHAQANPDPARREQARQLVDVLIPIVKGWSTEMAIDSASLGIQVHGGMGYIEETGAAQHWRDSRILTIYEGTTGIQANDLLLRKFLRDRGEGLKILMAQVEPDLARIKASGDPRLQALLPRLAACIHLLETSARKLVAVAQQDLNAALSVAVPFLNLASIACGAWQWGRAAQRAQARLAAGTDQPGFYDAQIEQAQFYMSHVATQCSSFAETISEGARAWEAPSA